MEKPKVIAYCINEGQPERRYGLKRADNGTPYLVPIRYHWKTYKGAIHWAHTHGMEIVEEWTLKK